MEGECFALVWAIQKFRLYLDGRHFFIYTDNSPLQWLHTARYQNSKVERWALKLQEYDFDIQHKKGTENLVADCLSRCISSAAIVCLAVQPTWDTGAIKLQREIEQTPCCVCNDVGGHDNMVICDGCDRYFHLRCLIPPRSIVPSGDWFCPGCDLSLKDSGQPRILNFLIVIHLCSITRLTLI